MGTIEVVWGDITTMDTEAVVNAANNMLAGGGGVDGAIHRRGGEVIARECAEIRRERGGCSTGDAVITSGGDLPSKYIIHTVGPVWHGGNSGEEELLRSSYRRSLELAVDKGIRSLAFPNISTGVYGYPLEKAAEAAVDEVRLFLRKNTVIERVVFVNFTEENYRIYKKLAG